MGKGSSINYPAQPSYGDSLRDSLRAQIDLGPEYYQAEAETRPRYAQLETDILRDTLLGRGAERVESAPEFFIYPAIIGGEVSLFFGIKKANAGQG